MDVIPHIMTCCGSLYRSLRWIDGEGERDRARERHRDTEEGIGREG